MLKEKEIKTEVEKRGEDYLSLRHDLIEAMTKYRWSPEEFFMYDYRRLSPNLRESFVPEYEKNIFCDKVNDYESSKVFDSKWRTYTVFRKYFKRDCCLVSKALLDANNTDVLEFLEEHRRFIIKPDSSASGRGIQVLTTIDKEDARRQVESILGNHKRKYVMEELIPQNEKMSCFHPQSVNTVRIRSFRFDDRVEILPSNMRLGRGDSYVDNTGQGGISVALDEGGRVIVACDEAGQYFEKHPDTGIPILKFQIPYWDKLISLVKEMSMVLPSVRYVGWDLALTDSGWVLVEGNDKGMFVGIQKPLQKGFRPKLNEILQEMSIKL